MNMNYDDYEEWIREFFNNSANFDWVCTHKNEIAKRLPAYFDDGILEHANLALNGLNLCSIILNEIHEYKIVSDLIKLALKSLFLEPDSGSELELEQHLATALLNRGYIDEAEELIEKGIERIDINKRSPELLALFINIILLKVYRKEFDHDEKQLNAIISMGYKMGYPMGDIYATVALAYFNQGMEKEMQDAIAKANKAYARDFNAPAKLREIGIARMYLRSAIALRLDPKRIDEAEKILDLAAGLFATTSYHMQYVSILYEKSQIQLVKGNYSAALQWINMAIEEQMQHHDPNPYYDAMLQHGKGLVLYYLKDYRIAAEYFLIASHYWKNMRNIYNHALSLNAVGSAQLGLEQAQDALTYLKLARELCESYEDNNNIKELMKTIDVNIGNANNLLANV